MAQTYKFMNSDMNFVEEMEQEQYETAPEFIQNLAYNINDQQESDIEATKQQNIENETLEEEEVEENGALSMKYQEADALIRSEIREVIFKKQTEKTTLEVVNEQKLIVMEQISNLQVSKDSLEREKEELNINADIEKEELQDLERRVLYNGEIIDKLEESQKTLTEGYKQIKSRNQKFLTKFSEEKKKICDFKNDWEDKIVKLKSDINNKKSESSNANSNDPIKKKISTLKSELLEKREYLERLQQKCNEIELRKENLNRLRSEKLKLEGILKDRTQKLQEMKVLVDQHDEETKERSELLNVRMEEKRTRLYELTKTDEELKHNLQEAIQKMDILATTLALKEKENAQLDENLSQLSTKVKDRQEELRIKSEECKKNTETAQNNLKESEIKLATLYKENDELSNNLEELKLEFIARIEEKSEKLELKFKLELYLKADEAILNKIKLLDEKNANKRKVIDDLSQAIENLSSDKKLQDLLNKKAYLISSTDYLSEKLENIKKEAEDMKLQADNIKQSVATNNNIIQEKQNEYDNLPKELHKLDDERDNFEVQRPPTSILKSPLSHKKFPISPKKVQFEGLSSYESSASSDPATEIPQQVVAKTLFDEILEEIHAGTFKKPEKLAKKRKVDIE